MKKTILILSQFLLILLPRFAKAQGGTGTVNIITPNGFFDKIRDKDGHTFDLANYEIKLNQNNNGINVSSATSCTAGIFIVYFANGSGMASLTSQVEADRRAVVCEVLRNLSALLGWANWSSSTYVRLLVDDITNPAYNVSSPSTSQVLGFASSFYAFPGSPASANPGIMESIVQRTIKSKQDAWTNVVSPVIASGGANFYHGFMAFNFVNSSFNWYTNYSIGLANSNEIDLYTVVLHEVTHALGFASLIDASGLSKFGAFNNYYSTYDTYLTDKTNTPLIISNSTCSPQYNYAFNSSAAFLAPGCPNSYTTDVTTCSLACKYISSSVPNMTVYTPGCFEAPSSLSHFEDMCYPVPNVNNNNVYFTMSNANGYGVNKRYLKEEERHVLCDLGYNVLSTYTSNAVGAPFTYTASPCSKSPIWGLNDGLTTGPNFMYASFGGALTIPITGASGILSNDATTASTAVCVETVYNNGVVSISGNNIIFTPNASYFGPVLLRYIPKDNSGNEGNITYIFGYIYPTACYPISPCDMVQNGGFETNNGCGSLVGSGIAAGCWAPFTLNPDLFKRACTSFSIAANLGNSTFGSTPYTFDSHNPLNNNNSVVGIGGFCYKSPVNGGPGGSESLISYLGSPLMYGQVYTLSFWANSFVGSKIDPVVAPTLTAVNPNNVPVVLSFGASNAAITPLGNDFPQPSFGLINTTQLSAPPNTWKYYSYTFTYTPSNSANGNILYVGINGNLTYTNVSNALLSNNYTYQYYVLIDDISIKSASTVPTFVLPSPTLCASQGFTNLAQYVNLSGGVFTGSDVVYTGTQYNYQPTNLANFGLQSITYSYTDNIGCSQNVVQQVSVVPMSEVNVAATGYKYCVGGSQTLTANGNFNSVTWQPGTLTANPIIVSPLANTIYTVVGNFNAGCTLSQTFAVNISTNCCASTITPVSSQYLSTQTLTGTWALNDNITVVSGNTLTLSGEFLIAPSVSITVNLGAALKIEGSHLYACNSEMWSGILIDPGARLISAPASTVSSNLIEDAITAVNFNNTYTNLLTTNIINLQNTTFNKNYVDIKLANYTQTFSTYPFTINNCVFTCRNLPFTATAWPQTGVATASASNGYSNLRYEINPASGLTAPYLPSSLFPIANLKNPYSGQVSQTGIQLDIIGNVTNLFYGIAIGSAAQASDFNLFDAHYIGLAANNCNVSCFNSVFQNSQDLYGVPGVGIRAAVNYTPLGTLNYKLDLGSSPAQANRFYDCQTALYAQNVAFLNVRYNQFKSTQSSGNTPTPTSSGLFGAYIKGNRYHDYQFISNQFLNVSTGIYVGAMVDNMNAYVLPASQPTIGQAWGTFSVTGNLFYPAASTSTTQPGGFISNAVTVENLLFTKGPVPNTSFMALIPFNGLRVMSNTMGNVWRGVTVNGFGSNNFSKTTANNTITLVADVNGAAQWGIAHRNNYQSIINSNLVTGYGTSTANPVSGIYNSMNSKSSTQCNIVSNYPRGIEFAGTNLGMIWRQNTMSVTTRAMQLSSTGNLGGIGQQGDALHPSDNYWPGSSNTFHTYTDLNSNPNNSQLYIRSATGFTPTLNGSQGQITQQYANNTSLFSATSTTFYPCYVNVSVVGTDATPREIINIAGRMGNPDEEAEEVARYLVYWNMEGDSTLAGSNDTLQTFYDTNMPDNMGKLADIEMLLASGQLSEAHDRLNDFTPNSNVEENYFKFYNLYYEFVHDGEISVDHDYDLQTLAAQCPFSDGAAIYKARTLYNISHQDYIVYNDDDCIPPGYSGRAMAPVDSLKNKELTNALAVNETKKLIRNSKAEYMIYPNPTTDLVYIKGTIENEKLRVTVTDVNAKVLIDKPVTLSNYRASLNTGLINGIYFVNLINDKGFRTVKKLVIAH